MRFTSDILGVCEPSLATSEVVTVDRATGEVVVSMYTQADDAFRASPDWRWVHCVWWPEGDARGVGQVRYRRRVADLDLDDDETLDGPMPPLPQVSPFLAAVLAITRGRLG